MSNYEKYQLQWMMNHGHSLSELIQELTDMQFEDPEDSDRISTPVNELFQEWEFDRGFGSEIWVCEKEWEKCDKPIQFFEDKIAEINNENINRSLKVLIDNGIEEDEAYTVLQALGYTLLDTELFPEEV